MKKIRLLALILCMVAATACFFACGKPGTSESAGSTGGSDTIRMSEIGLDLFEDKELTLPESVSGVAAWASADETIVTVKDGVVSAMGQKEGLAEVSATVGDISVIYPIRVTDTGDRPFLTVDAFSVYKGKTADIKEHLTLTYKETDVTEGVTYTYNPVGNQVTVAEDGTVSGVAAGMTKIQVRATYRGFTTAAKAVSVTVEESDIVKPVKDKVSLSILEGDVDPTSYEIEAEVFVNAEKVEGATVVASIEEGEEFVGLDGLTVTAKAIGKAVILLTYNNGETTVTGRIEITVHDDTVEYNAGALMSPNAGSTFNKVFEGEFEGCYAYTLGKEGNYWDNAVVSSTLESIPNNGYKTFSYDIYLVDSAALVVYIPSAFQSNSGAYCMYDFSTTGNKFGASLMGKYTGDDDLLHIYGADGQRLADGTELVTGQWYTVVYDLSTYTDGWSMMGFSINATANGQKAYLRNFAYHTTANLLPNGTYDARHPIGEVEDPEVTDEKDDFLNKLIIGSKAVSVKKVANGDFAGSYKIRSQTTASSGTISFNDIHNNAFEPQRFFTEGYHYIKFDIYIASGNGLGICNWIKGVDGKADVKLETTITPDTATHDTVRIYNERGNLSALKQGGWYTVLVDVPYDENNLPEWDLFYIGLPGSKYVPAIGYVRNFEYLKTDPEIVGDSSKIAQELTTAASLVKQTEAIDGVEEAYLYTNNTANWYAGRLDFKPETYYNKAVALKVRYNDAARLFFSINYVNSYDRNNWTFDKNIHHFTLSGEYVKTPVENVWYELVIDLTATGNRDWMNYITMDATGETGKGVYIADLRILDERPFDIPEEDTSNIAKYIARADESTIEKVGTYEGVENAYKYTNNGNWYTGRISIDVNAFKGKYISIKIRNEHTGTFNLYQNQKPVTSCSYAKIYSLSGKKVTEMLKDTWYEIVLDYTGIAPEESYWCSYLEGTSPLITYLADLQILDENPYPEENPDPEETNIDMMISRGTIEKQAGKIDGVANAYLYTNKSGSFYDDVIGFDLSTLVTKGKVTMLKAKLNGSATVNYSIDWVNSVQKGSGWTFDNNIYYRTLKGDKVSALSADEWRYIVIDLSGLTNWVNYICVNPNESMYIADLQILDKDPFFSVIDKYLSAPEAATMERVGTFENVENAYKYTNTGNWWSGRLDVKTADFAGKYVSVKIYIDYSGTFILGEQAAAIGELAHVKIYNLQGEEVPALSQGVWYEVVMDYTATTPETWWSSRIEPSSTIITYLADLQILDENPHAANA